MRLVLVLSLLYRFGNPKNREVKWLIQSHKSSSPPFLKLPLRKSYLLVCHGLKLQKSPSVWASKSYDSSQWLCLRMGRECCINLNLIIGSLLSKAITPHPSGSGWGLDVLVGKALGTIPSRKGLFALRFIKTSPSQSCLLLRCQRLIFTAVWEHFFVLQQQGGQWRFWFPFSPQEKGSEAKFSLNIYFFLHTLFSVC